MRKTLTVMFAAVLMFLMGALGLAQASAAGNSQMADALSNNYKSAHYDYKEGSFKLQHVKTFQLSDPIKVKKDGKDVEVTKVTAAVATFKTVRDYIFYKDWKEFAFYAPDIDQVLTLGDVSKVKALQDYQKKYQSSVSLELGPILLLMAFLFIIPIIVLIIWSKTRYSVMGYKVENNLLDDNKN